MYVWCLNCLFHFRWLLPLKELFKLISQLPDSKPILTLKAFVKVLLFAGILPPTHSWGLPQILDQQKSEKRGTFPTAKQVLIHFRTKLECFNLEWGPDCSWESHKQHNESKIGPGGVFGPRKRTEKKPRMEAWFRRFSSSQGCFFRFYVSFRRT